MNTRLKIKDDLIDQILGNKSLFKGNQIMIFSKPYIAEIIYNSLKKERVREGCLFLLPHSETLPYDFFSSPTNIRNQRMRTLSKLLLFNDLTLITSIQSLITPCPDKVHLLPVNELKVGEKIDRNQFLESLVSSGYKKDELVFEVGEFSVRGSIIDVYATGSRLPVRIEIYEDKVESLRFFNPKTQLTTMKLESLSTLPPQEYPLNKESIENFKINWRKKFDTYEEDSEIFQNICKGKSADGAEMYLPLFFNKKTTPIKYLHNFKKILMDSEVTKSLAEYESFINERFEEYRYDIERPLLNPQDLFLNSVEFLSFLEGKEITNLKVHNLDSYQLKELTKPEEEENYIYPTNTIPSINDRVVHLFHGIGIYRGLKQLTTSGGTQDCLEIEYYDESKVYVPTHSIHLVSKYFGPEDTALDKLGSKRWNKKKVRAIKRSFDVAAELLQIQATRESKEGSIYEIPLKEYKDFSKEFPYIETKDQLKTITEIEKDLTSSKPMDRLVCGEVGFGKTEVAMRASFITAFNNHQTCLLVPTTLLAQQHFESFTNRFSKTPVKIAKISRDVSLKKKKDILEDLEKGNIDILIGTHAILQNSVRFSNLGLLVIDEEHKFGVRQKEKIKSLKEEVNLLYLSATPIPRSLNISLSELKDFSIIATAPNERLSVKTFIHSFNQNLIKESIQREILRGGQVYYLCNDLRLIEDRKQRLQEMFRTYKIEIIHGKLKSNIIEKIMISFQKGEIDILLCSTIIESGIDIRNANTLIIEDADRLGLAQLHQIRGRVGRGNKQAFAYLLKSKGMIKRKSADSRLDALKESNSLSAGFLLALKDLEIRGAGEILGSNQSGVMESVGIDLYIKLVKSATDQIKNGVLELDFIEKNVDIDLGVSAYIPESYLPDINQRLLMYNRISSVDSEEELKQIQIEMINRFGLFPKELRNLFQATELSILAKKKNIKKIRVFQNNIILAFFDSQEKKVLPKGIDFDSTIKKIYKELNIIERFAS